LDLFILTGASRGLGRAMAEQLLRGDRLLLTISRKPDRALEDAARTRGARLEQWALDLAHDIGVAARLEAWLRQHVGGHAFGTATLINNAGLLGRGRAAAGCRMPRPRLRRCASGWKRRPC
jgi:benzil reductase ((S)-benzoin forming)